MAENLYPDGYETEGAALDRLASREPPGFRNGVLFDYRLGDFPRDGRNRLLDSTGIESWEAWVRNCTMTERYKHLAYSSDFGLELDPVFQAASREEAESLLTRQITEALLADPYQRTAYIEDITYTWTAADAVEARITVHGREDVTIDVTAYITQGGG